MKGRGGGGVRGGERGERVQESEVERGDGGREEMGEEKGGRCREG